MKIERDNNGHVVAITMTRPDDMHLHLRDGVAMKNVLGPTARVFRRAIVMPNLTPPIRTADDALQYKEKIISQIKRNPNADAQDTFEPLMTLYLTDHTTPQNIMDAKSSGIVYACKLYPAGATTNSSNGVTNIEAMDAVFKAMAQHDMVLCIHAEVTDPDVDIFDREAVFIERHLRRLVQQHPDLKVVMEHITTSEGVDFVWNARENVVATITPQHMLFNRNQLLVGGIKPDYYCLPILKAEAHRNAVAAAAVSGSAKFFLGTDSAPHASHKKYAECGCAGCYSAPYAMEFYATAFEVMDALDQLEGFASHFGADFYGLPRNKDHVILYRTQQKIRESFSFGEDVVVPLMVGKTLSWQCN